MLADIVEDDRFPVRTRPRGAWRPLRQPFARIAVTGRATYLVLRAARNAGSGRLPSGLEGLCVDQEGSGMKP